ncbi:MULTISPECIES: rod shape-determining protein MreC [Streptococcus]|uniref:rod shape-determining protein MreC n=1 Tax=Streptococcus TaxID=1301 RepID=UPI0008A504F8|nr:MULTISPECIES: rod shape-determining protein MreC [Streptococcus]MCP9062940.1 rod shape-determining protein MreC [Streptococcus salivarius]MCP9064853.1 rod shape-determining protein MreC [Streptococcus salivarius]MDU7740036.1 rod shape-determining protein MreC [Streptococcus sp.]OFO03635.1 rod shape-determining protein MreC [Streptococcus sp. HMSC078H03]
MKNSFYRFLLYGFIIILFFVMLFSFVFTNKKLTKDISSNVSGFVTKVDSVASVPFTALSKSHNVISDLLSTYNENRDLKKSLSNLENQSSIISNLQEENDSLRASLNLSDKLSRDTVLTAEVSMRPSVTWLKELTINVGKSKNVSKSMLATSNGGVIGFVTKVYDDTTTISLLSSSSSDSYLASSVKSEDDNQIFGIISRYDNKKKLLEMTQLNSSSNVKVGTEVVTSGLDDVSVKDVPIGTVDSVSDYEGNRTILVKPYADFDKISYVTLVGDGK